MADINLKTETPDTSLPSDGFLFGADSQAASSPSVYTTQAVATTLLGSTTLSGTTITANAPVLNLSQTWNNAAVTFTGLQFNATDTTSNAASLLMDLQVGGSSKYAFRKDGLLTINYPVSGSGIRAVGNGNGFIASAFGSDSTGYGPYGLRLQSDNTIEWSTSSNGLTGGSVVLSRRATANLQLGQVDAAAPVAQTLSVQSVVAGTTNGAGANFTITGSQGTGTGAGGSIIFQVAPAGSSGSAQNALSTALTINSSKQLVFPDSTAPTTLIQFQYSGYGIGSNNNGDTVIRVNGTDRAAIGNNISLWNGGAIGFSSASSVSGGALDTILVRDAANTLALRNGTAAQLFNIYNTFTDASNFARATSSWNGNDWVLGTFAAGSGTAGGIQFYTAGTSRWRIGTDGHLTATVDNAYDIGAVSGNRPRYLYLAGGSLTGSAANSSLEISPTWNTSGTPTAIKLNVTDTASNAASLLMDLGTGGGSFVSKFNVDKSGAIYGGGSTGWGISGSNPLFTANGNGAMQLSNTGGGLTSVVVGGSGGLGLMLAGTQAGTGVPSVIITAPAARNLRLGAADAATALAQTFSVQSVVAGTTNGAGANFTITGSQGTGSGVGGRLELQFAPAGGGGGATIQNPLVRSFSFVGLSATVSFLYGPADGTYLLLGNDVALENANTGRPIDFRTNSGPVNITGSGAYLAWSTSNANTNPDLRLYRDAANTLALRNGGTNASPVPQAFNIYSFYAGAADYSRLSIRFIAGQVDLASEVAGTGAGSTFNLGTVHANNIAFYTSNSTRWNIAGATGHFLAAADDTYDIGTNTATRPRSIYAATSITPGRGVTVATLPTPATGMVARVTDASAPVIGSTVVGGGAAYALVNYNGANWTVIGV